MSHKGWHNINRLQKPVCAMIQVAFRKTFLIEQFLKDLAESVELVRKNPKDYAEGMAAVYGMAATLPDRDMVSDLLLAYTSSIYKV